MLPGLQQVVAMVIESHCELQSSSCLGSWRRVEREGGQETVDGLLHTLGGEGEEVLCHAEEGGYCETAVGLRVRERGGGARGKVSWSVHCHDGLIYWRGEGLVSDGFPDGLSFSLLF